MRIPTAVAAAFALLSSADHAVAQTDRVPLTQSNAPFIYEAFADVPAPTHKLAEIISSDYRDARDEFTRHDLFEQLRPVIQRRLEEARSTTAVSLLARHTLGEYDFDKGAFPTGLVETTYYSFNLKHKPWTKYEVVLANGADLTHLPVDIAHARTLASSLRTNRETQYQIEAVVEAAKEQGSTKRLSIRVTKLTAKLRSGRIVGTLTAN